ncbi:cytosolic phospholipase A2 gamma isoform X2 [Heterocephalus glaber]|uniref:Cytosolic phospholipase A2 gamma isoform X2 n=1 Tax=Heterocephalus glaber TaxID=10181 RepID=A0AAX6QN77_HETGA|nr:cytosolic phospholipase A2 gamma isoform X2 [Heterocephalus glaber]
MNPENLSKLPLFNKNSFVVSIIPGLQKEEQEAVEKRGCQVLTALKKLSKDNEAWNLPKAQPPVIAVLGSGGGLRAHIACLGVLSELKTLGLLDAVTYLSGVSGSTWALSSFYTKDGNTEDIEAELKHRFDQKEWDFKHSLEKTVEAGKLENYSLTDFWAYIVVSKQTRELQDSCLSSMTKHVEEGTLPYPIFAAIDDDLHRDHKEKAQNPWFEFTPHHAGYPALGAYIPIAHFGSKFMEGRLVRPEPERDLSFLKGLWGSALASLEEIKNFILDQLLSLKEKLNMTHLHLKGERFYHESTEVAGWIDSTGTIVEELLDLAMTYIKDPNAPGILEKLQVLQQKLEAGRRGDDEVSETALRWLAEMAQDWNNVSPEDQGKFLEQLVQCFMKLEEHSGLSSYPRLFFKDVMSEILDTFKVLIKTGVCCFKWEWGTIYNFLYKHGDIEEKEMSNRELLHLVDAGFAINSPYPLVLLPARNVQLILSFDFSAGDPFETIRSTAKYCHDHKIPFPLLEEAKLKEWSAAPKSCYILKGEKGPVVMHFPLFNIDTCGADIQKLSETYDTFKMADSYTLDLVTQLLRLSKENVSKNKETILSQIRSMASSP